MDKRRNPAKRISFQTPPMEKSAPIKEGEDQIGLFSCWARLRLRLPWKKRDGRGSKCCKLTSVLRARHPRQGGFRYDPLSYAQNFDEGDWDEESENYSRGFSSRFAVPLSKSIHDR